MSFDFENMNEMDFLGDISVWDDACEELLQEFQPTNIGESTDFSQEVYPDVAKNNLMTYANNEETLKRYATFMESGINAHSLDLLMESLQMYCTEDIVSIFYFPKGNPHSHSYRECRGLNVTADFLHKNFSSAPDSIYLTHSTQVNYEPDGSVVVSSKMSCNGTRLHVITSQVDGYENPDAPAVKVLFNTIKKIHPNSKSDNIDHFFESVDASRQPITLKKNKDSKFNRYKHESTNSIGAHIEYATFSESSLQNHKKKHTDMDENSETIGEFSNVKVRTTGGQGASNSRKSYKNYTLKLENQHSQHGNNSINSESQSINNIYSSVNRSHAEQAFVTKLTTQISSKFSADEIMIADNRTSFGFSDLLPVPISYDIHGITKYYLNADNKVHLMEIILASKEIKIPK